MFLTNLVKTALYLWTFKQIWASKNLAVSSRDQSIVFSAYANIWIDSFMPWRKLAWYWKKQRHNILQKAFPNGTASESHRSKYIVVDSLLLHLLALSWCNTFPMQAIFDKWMLRNFWYHLKSRYKSIVTLATATSVSSLARVKVRWDGLIWLLPLLHPWYNKRKCHCIENVALICGQVLMEMDIYSILRQKFSSKANAEDLLDGGERPNECWHTVVPGSADFLHRS